jgi:hypothetical protein
MVCVPTVAPSQISQRRPRDSMSTESMLNTLIFTEISSFCIDTVDMESLSTLTHLTGNETLYQLPPNDKKNLNMSANSRVK